MFALSPPRFSTASIGFWIVTVLAFAMGLLAAFVTRDVETGTVALTTPTAVHIVAVIAVGGLLAFRRHIPLVALSGILIAVVVWRGLELNSVGMDAALLLATYHSALTVSRRAAAVGAIASFFAIAIPVVIIRPAALTDGSIVPVVLILALAHALAEGARSRRAQMAALSARAEQAEQSRESEARRQVVEERLRIARDLHDGVAHQMAVINLHAGAAREAMAKRPDITEQSLAVISSSAQTVLAEISDLLGILRRVEPSVGGEQTPAHKIRTLNDLAELADSFRSDGLDVEVVQRGDPRPLTPSVDGVAVRVVREGLTNAFKHAQTPHALVTLTWLDKKLAIEVRNDVAAGKPTPRVSGGHGLLGVQEWAESVGGSASTRVHTDQFRLSVELPVAERVLK